jgi:hypothetical protein
MDRGEQRMNKKYTRMQGMSIRVPFLYIAFHDVDRSRQAGYLER